MKIKNFIFIGSVCLLIINLLGCDAFVRKFTRKPKKDNLPQEEMVLVPEEYKGPNLSKDDLYRKYFMFWKSWQEELVRALSENLSLKKRIDCAEQAIKNLLSLRALLKPEKQKQLDSDINRLKDLRNSIANDIYNRDTFVNLSEARHIKLNIFRDFSYPEVKNDLI